MPRVPGIQRQNEVGGIPKVRYSGGASIENFGGGQAAQNVGEAFSGAVQAGQGIYDNAKKRANDTAFFDADLKASELEQRLELGIKEMRGKDSAGAPDYVSKEWEKGIAEITKDMNSDVRNRFDRSSKMRLNSLNKVSNVHAFSEIDKYEDTQNLAYQEQVRREVYANAGDAERLAMSIAQQEAAIEKNAEKYGLSDAVKSLQKKDAISKTHLTSLNGLLDTGQFDLATEYYEKNKGFIYNPADAQRAQNLVESGTLAAKSQKESDAIFSKTTSLSQAMQETKSIEDPKLRDETTRRLRDMYTIKKQAEAEADERNTLSAYNILDATPDVNKIPRSVWSSLPGATRSALEKYASDKIAGKEPPPNSVSYSDKLLLLSNPSTRMEEAKKSLLPLKGKVTNAEYKELLKLQAGVIDNDPASSKLLGGIETVNQAVTRTLKNAKIEGDSDSGRLFFNKANALAAQFEQTNGRRPDTQEVQAMVDSLLIEGVTQKNSLFGIDFLSADTSKKTFELEDGESFQEMDSKKIPRIERDKIVDYLRRNKKPITEDNIKKLFTMKFRGK